MSRHNRRKRCPKTLSRSTFPGTRSNFSRWHLQAGSFRLLIQRTAISSAPSTRRCASTVLRRSALATVSPQSNLSATGENFVFLLSGSEYDVFWPYVEHALWPDTAPDPDDAADQYLSELDKLRTGLPRLTVVRSDVSENDEVRFAEFRMEFIAPTTYQFVPSLPSHAVACRVAMLPMKERIPARISPADPGKYRNVQDASDWNNPFVVITSDGFNLRFHGGQMHGPLSTLARTVLGLPDSAWPYGRALAASESGVQ
jgi:hypothetical protein